MLEGLDSINWKNLSHAYGDASDVPGFLNRLANETDFRNWKNVLGDFANHVFHQETVYSVTAYTIPFINQILTNSYSAKTNELLSLLARFLQHSLENNQRIGADGLPAVHYQRAVREAITGSVDFVDFYIRFLGDPEPSVRVMAATLCLAMGQCLITALLDSDNDVRAEAAQALGNLGDERAVKPLLEALRDHHWDVRERAAIALSSIGQPAVEPLIAALHDNNNHVRENAAGALGWIEDARAVEPLLATLRDSDRDVRIAAQEALIDIGEPAVASLIPALRDHNESVRIGAQEALSEIGQPAVASLISVLRDSDKNVRIAAQEALGYIGTPEALAALEEWQHEQGE